MTTVVLFGRPASGKGTLGQRLTAEHGFVTCSTGQAMREWAAGPDPEQVALRATMAAGDYGSDELAVRIVREFIANVPLDASGVILDGFPRDRAQLDAWLASTSDPGVAVLVDTPAAVCRSRVLGRMVCAACGWTDHAPAMRCDRCGATLTRRADDGDAATFDHRMAEYHQRVAPLIEAWREAGHPMVRLDGTVGAAAMDATLMTALAALTPDAVAVGQVS
jgi:adenylate kinase